MSELASRLRELLSRGALNLPLPAGGATAERHRRLLEFGCSDLSVARLAEAHTDAIAILAEDERDPDPRRLYGVWASDSPDGRLSATQQRDGSWCLNGVKQYCSGASLIDSALVTAHTADGVVLFDVALDTAGVTVLASTWVSPAFADTSTGPVSFDTVALPDSARLGGPAWYLERTGFWHGAIGPAACWAGGACFLIDAARRLGRKDAHSRAQLGALLAAEWAICAVLTQAGQEIDVASDDRESARRRGLMVRHVIERQCTDVIDRFGRATGPQLLAYDASVARQHAALVVYIRQCHAERDLETIPGQP